MTKIYGTIESLASLKSELEKNGIHQFNSVKQLNKFLSNYDSEKRLILTNELEKVEIKYNEVFCHLKELIQQKKDVLHSENAKIDYKVSKLKSAIQSKRKENSNFIKTLISKISLYFLQIKLSQLQTNKEKIISASIKGINNKIKKNELFINRYDSERFVLAKERAKPKIEQLEHTRTVIENLKNLISGAIGENLVVKEIKKLPDDYILINDFKLSFSRPIYHKKYDQRIYSVQIDHLLVSRAGIFIIETKNWSKASVDSISLRSPIEQIERSNFALYVYLSESLTLNEHQWGEQRIPIRNLIVMINHKPKAEFKYVKIKLLKELNDYIQFFEPVLTEKQLNQLVNKLL